MTKICNKCGIKKIVHDFYKRKSEGRLHGICRKCENARKRLWLIRNPSKKKEYVDKMRRNYPIQKSRYFDRLEIKNKRIAASREWRNENALRVHEYNILAYRRMPEKIRTFKRAKISECIKNLGDPYVRYTLKRSHNLSISSKLIPQNILEAKREQMKLKRLVKSYENTQTH